MEPSKPLETVIRELQTFDDKASSAVNSLSPEQSATPVRPSSQDPKDVAFELSRELSERNFHPVLLYGTTSSGKSTLLASILGYLQADENSNLDLKRQARLIPGDGSYSDEIHAEANKFLDATLYDYRRNLEAAPATRFQYPIFIPVTMKRRTGSNTEVNFAFLEAQGEFHNPEMNGNHFIGFKPLKEEIAAVLKNFPGGLSIIYIAPYTTAPSYTSDDQYSSNLRKNMEMANLSLVGSLESYLEVRAKLSNEYKDHHLFLLTKWDVHTDGVNSADFLNPTPEKVKEIISAKFNEAWVKFCGMQGSRDIGSRHYMQYSAGPISHSRVLPLRKPEIERGYRYPRTILNWLWGNATGGEILYDDVLLRRRGVFQKFLDALTTK
jgi:energy-coupling factor transporter ATP-binding protein EcfA2